MKKELFSIIIVILLLTLVFSGCFEEKSDKDTSSDISIKNELLGDWFIGYKNSNQMWTFYKNGSILNTFYDSWEKPEITFKQDDINKTLTVISINSTDGLGGGSWANYEIKNNKLCFSGEGTVDVFCLNYSLNGDTITLSGEINGTDVETKLVKSELSPNEVFDIDDKVGWDDINVSLWLSVFDVKPDYSSISLQRSSVSYYGEHAPTEWGEVIVGDVLFVGEYNFGLSVDLDWIEGFWPGGHYYFSSDLETKVGFIQNLINNASYGDIITVPSGSYLENIVIDKELTLIGEGKNTTIISGISENYTVSITADNVKISGFTINKWEYCDNNKGGIKVQSNNVEIENNVITKNNDSSWGAGSGIYLESSSNNNIINNNINNNGGDGIYLESSSNNNIINNYIVDNSGSCINLEFSSDNNVIENNIFNSTSKGVYIAFCNINTISDNNFINNGLTITDSTNINVDNNLVNGKPLIYLEAVSNMIIDSNTEAGQIILNQCNNIEIEGHYISNTDRGIQLIDTNNCTLINNNFNNNSDYGIYLSTSDNNLITNNELIKNNRYGLHLDSQCNNNIIDNNIIEKCGTGIHLWASDNNIFNGNQIKNNKYNGINLFSSSNNNIKNNIISNNNGQGVTTTSNSNDNRIFNNNYIGNAGENADDNGNNIWYNSSQNRGNYWDDYLDKYPDASNDGIIWDTPYSISGENNQDIYPLVNPVNI